MNASRSACAAVVSERKTTALLHLRSMERIFMASLDY
jgi:hypothetical protein